MAVLKCKMCGGNLDLVDDSTVVECEYCGTKQTVPTADNEKKMTLFARANRLRSACEFDKAAGVYESIVAEFPEEAEAYWGLVLCKYGIEYVDDPATGKKIPTCHRSSFDSIMDDSDFEQVMENADSIARRVYREEAKTIEEIRKGILEVSSKEEPYDIFICYKETDEDGNRTIDSVIAQDIYYNLTEKGYRVFFARISLEDKLGTAYEPYIFAALNSAKIMLAIGTDYDYYNAVWVKNEWSRFLALIAKGEKKTLIPCYKDIDAYDIPKEFKHLQAQDMGKVGAMQDLIRGVGKLLPKKEQVTAPRTVVVDSSNNDIQPLLKRIFMYLEDGEWDKADEYSERVLDKDPENSEAYLGKLMIDLKVRCRDDLKNQVQPFDDNKYYQKAIRFSDEKTKRELNDDLASINNRILESKYAQAKEKAEEAKTSLDYRKVVKLFNELGDYKDSAELAEKHIKVYEEKSESDRDYRKRIAQNKYNRIIAAGAYHTIGLRFDGTVVAVGRNGDGQCNVKSWSDIATIAAGHSHTVGIKSDGTVVAVGYNYYGPCDVKNWKDIVAIAAGYSHTIGLRSDGTVVAVGENDNGQCDVKNWKDIVAIAAGRSNTVGIKSDGTVVAVGENDQGQCDVKSWTDIVAIAVGFDHVVGMKSDGTVVAVGENLRGQCNVKNWTDVVAIAAGNEHTVGLKSNGTVVAVGYNYDDECKVFNWKLFLTEEDKQTYYTKACALQNSSDEKALYNAINLFRTIRGFRDSDKRAAECIKMYKQKRSATLNSEKFALQTELANLKGLFLKMRRKQIEARIAEIETELKSLA
jgi:tetratricopeptide (TPR) repeat protein